MAGSMQDHSLPVSVTRLFTRRLTLREYRASDFDAYAAHLAEPEATALYGVVDRASARRMFASDMAEWLRRGVGWWAVKLRDSATVVGTVGAFFREPFPEIELGWNTHRAHCGHGFATEAATEVVRYVFDVRRERRVTALIDPRNAASLRVAAHLGMTFETDADLPGKPLGRYVRARD